MPDNNDCIDQELLDPCEIQVLNERNADVAAEAVGFLAVQNESDSCVSKEAFSTEALLDKISEPLQVRSDSFDILLDYARWTADEVISTARQVATAHSHNLGNHSRRLEKKFDAKIKTLSNVYVLGTLSDVRLEASGSIASVDSCVNASEITRRIKELGVKLPGEAVRNINIGDSVLPLQAGAAVLKDHDEKIDFAIEAAKHLTAAEDSVWGCLGEALASSDDIVAFVDWLTSLDTAEQDDMASLLELLAVDMHDKYSPHKFQSILEDSLKVSVRAIDRLFVQDLFVNESETAKSVVSWARIFIDDDNKSAHILHEKKDSWPDPLHRSRSSFEAIIREELVLRLTEKTRPFYTKYQQIPHVSRTTDTHEANQFRGKGNLSVLTDKNKRPKNGRVTPKATINTELVTPEENKIVLLNNDGTEVCGVIEEQDALGKIAKDYASQYPHEKRLTADISAMLESVRKRPFGNGTTPLATMYLPDGSRVRRLNPVFQSGLPTATEIAKDTRIIYTTKRSDDGSHVVGVLAVLRHDDYLRWIASFRGSSPTKNKSS